MTTHVRMDAIFWEVGKFYHKKWCEENPGKEVSLGVIVIGMLRALEQHGQAVKHEDTDGSVTWKATPKFLASFPSRGAGPLIVLGEDVH